MVLFIILVCVAFGESSRFQVPPGDDARTFNFVTSSFSPRDYRNRVDVVMPVPFPSPCHYIHASGFIVDLVNREHTLPCSLDGFDRGTKTTIAGALISAPRARLVALLQCDLPQCKPQCRLLAVLPPLSLFLLFPWYYCPTIIGCHQRETVRTYHDVFRKRIIGRLLLTATVLGHCLITALRDIFLSRRYQ